MWPGSKQTQHASRIGLIGRFAQQLVVHGDHGIGSNDQFVLSIRLALLQKSHSDRMCFALGQPQYKVDWRLSGGRRFVDVGDMNVKIKDLEEEVGLARTQLSSLSEEHATTTQELSGRLEKEAKFKKAKTSLNPSEGEVLFNSSNDIVLRLSGLSFDIGKSDIQDEHVALLEKVKEVIQMFPDAQLVLEGHTDASGEPAANVQLSEKRAFAVMQYLRQSLLISAGRIRSIGYGADRPIASNQTPDGRAKNRRIDIIIMQ